MYPTIQFKPTIPPVRNSSNRPSWRGGLFLIPLVFVCFAFSPRAQAVSPAPDGGYPGQNTAEGQQALFSLTTGTHNTALGAQALFLDHAGNYNTATGSQALFHNISGDYNVATGAGALFSNTTGYNNTANGVDALHFNTTGHQNTANGFQALNNNTTGIFNTADGVVALQSNTTGFENTATGTGALQFNTSGDSNTAEGFTALGRNTTGRSNTANGFQALVFNTTGNKNIALGFLAGVNLTTGDDNIDIGNVGVAAESDTIRVGTQGTQTNAYIAGIFGVSVPNGLGVVVDLTGHLGTVASSKRFKDEIKPMDKASEAILALKPVTFHYKKELDPKGIPQFGLVAEDVEKVNPDLVARDAKGEVYTVRYEAVNAMLLNEFLKEHRKVADLETTVAQQQKEFQATTAQQQKEFESKIAHQQEQIEALTAGLQKVSHQPELSRPIPQIIANNQ
jgi:hypothetical protein